MTVDRDLRLSAGTITPILLRATDVAPAIRKDQPREVGSESHCPMRPRLSVTPCICRASSSPEGGRKSLHVA